MERWKQIPFLNGNYEASTDGRIRSLDRISKMDGHIMPGRLLVMQPDNSGYGTISILGKTRRWHRIIAATFLENPEKKPYVNHKNGIKSDNRVSNLEWCTGSENVDHAIKTGLHKTKISDSDTLFIRENFKTIGKHELAKMFKVTAGYIYDVATHRFKNRVPGVVYQTNSPMASIPVLQYDTSGVLIGKHESISIASRKANIRLGRVQEVLKGQRKSYRGFVFKYA